MMGTRHLTESAEPLSVRHGKAATLAAEPHAEGKWLASRPHRSHTRNYTPGPGWGFHLRRARRRSGAKVAEYGHKEHSPYPTATATTTVMLSAAPGPGCLGFNSRENRDETARSQPEYLVLNSSRRDARPEPITLHGPTHEPSAITPDTSANHLRTTARTRNTKASLVS